MTKIERKPTIKEAETTTKKTVIKKYDEKELLPVNETIRNVGLNKEYLKTKNICQVTFRMPKVAIHGAKSVCIVGDFNNWNIHANPMEKLKNGDYTIKLDLETGREYQFRYLIDEERWETDWNADKYVKSHYGDSDNSVVVTD